MSDAIVLQWTCPHLPPLHASQSPTMSQLAAPDSWNQRFGRSVLDPRENTNSTSSHNMSSESHLSSNIICSDTLTSKSKPISASRRLNGPPNKLNSVASNSSWILASSAPLPKTTNALTRRRTALFSLMMDTAPTSSSSTAPRAMFGAFSPPQRSSY